MYGLQGDGAPGIPDQEPAQPEPLRKVAQSSISVQSCNDVMRLTRSAYRFHTSPHMLVTNIIPRREGATKWVSAVLLLGGCWAYLWF